MLHLFKKLLFIVFFNASLFLILIIGTQNNSKKSKIYFFKNESINLPIGFIVGASFISGSIAGNFLSLNSQKERTSSQREIN